MGTKSLMVEDRLVEMACRLVEVVDMVMIGINFMLFHPVLRFRLLKL